MTRLRERLARHRGGDRQFVTILSIVADGIEAVNVACELALEEAASAATTCSTC